MFVNQDSPPPIEANAKQTLTHSQSRGKSVEKETIQTIHKDTQTKQL